LHARELFREVITFPYPRAGPISFDIRLNLKPDFPSILSYFRMSNFPKRQFLKGSFGVMNIEVLPSTRPSIIKLEVPGEDVQTAFDTRGESLRERVLLALIESLVYDVSDLRDVRA
jgi:hypothetical protein